MASDLLVIGAGLSGVVAAREATRADLSVRVLEKGRGIGGRMAHRGSALARFDHGAQFFTARSRAFREEVGRWVGAGVACEWFQKYPGNPDNGPGHPRYRGAPGMTAPVGWMANGLDVQLESRVTRIERRKKGWRVWIESAAKSEWYEAGALLLTPPLPQSCSLLEASGVHTCLPPEAWRGLWEIEYAPNLTLLAELTGSPELAGAGGIPFDPPEPLAWLADNTAKGISPGAFSLTAHSGPEFARRYWDSPDSERIPAFWRMVQPHLAAGVELRAARLHRWRYARTLSQHPERAWFDTGARLGFCGDAFREARVEGAYLSGLEAGRLLVDALVSPS